MPPIKIILDTDIGGDIDDVLALALALNSPELELLAVTTVNTDPKIRARIAAKMLHTFSHPYVSVAPGEARMFDGAPTHCKDINGAVVVTLDDPVPRGSGVDLIIQTAQTHRSEAVIVGIGCWTNIARAFEKAPELSQIVPRLVLMGGRISPPEPESNVVCDPAAAAYVLDLPVPKLIVPLDVTMLTRYRVSRHGELICAGRPSTNLVRDLLRAYQIGRRGGDPSAEPILHDPLAVALTFDPTLIRRREPMCLRVQRNSEGRPVTEPNPDGPPNAEVVLEVDVPRFEALFAERIVR